MNTKLLALGFASAICVLPILAAADERILSYHSDILVRQNGWVEVTEIITVKAEGSRIRRGIYRDFTTSYRDRFGNRVQVDYQPRSVLRDGMPEAFHLQNVSNGVRTYFGSADHFLSPGKYTYTFRYDAGRMLDFFASRDELHWNVTGLGWDFPIDRASAKVTFEFDLPPDSVRVDGYTGPFGVKGRNFVARTDRSGKAEFDTTAPLAEYEGLTIVVNWPKGFVTPPTKLVTTSTLNIEPIAPNLPEKNRPLVLAIDGIAWKETTGAVSIFAKPRTGMLKKALEHNWDYVSDKDIHDVYWVGDLTQTDALVDVVKNHLRSISQLATSRGKPLVVVTHSWGSVLAYRAIDELGDENKGGATPLKIDQLITLGSPLDAQKLGYKTTAQHYAEWKKRGGAAAILGYVDEWRNYWIEADIISGAISGIDKNVLMASRQTNFLRAHRDYYGGNRDLSLIHQIGVDTVETVLIGSPLQPGPTPSVAADVGGGAGTQAPRTTQPSTSDPVVPAAELACYSDTSSKWARQCYWITDQQNGCRVWNPHPIPKNRYGNSLTESITWSGDCVSGRAHGNGILRWYENGIEYSRDTVATENGVTMVNGVLTANVTNNFFTFRVIECTTYGYRYVRGEVEKTIDLGNLLVAWEILAQGGNFAQNKCSEESVSNITVTLHQGGEKPVVRGRNYDDNEFTWREYDNKAYRERDSRERSKMAAEKQKIAAAIRNREAEARQVDKERRTKEIRSRRDAFASKNGVVAWPPMKELSANPFVYEGDIVGIRASFSTMQSATQALFFSSAEPFVVSDVPRNLLRVKGQVVVLAGRVLGKVGTQSAFSGEIQVPHLKFADVYFCENRSCDNMLGK